MVSFGVTENGGSTWTTRRSLEGIANIDMHGALTGVTGINNVTFILVKKIVEWELVMLIFLGCVQWHCNRCE